MARLYTGAFLSEGLRVSWGVPKGGELGLMRYILDDAGEVGTFETLAQDRLRYTWFQRSFRLPDTADEDNIKAEFDKGLLHVSIPKKEGTAAASKTISISSKR